MAEAIAEAYAEIGADLTGLDAGIAQVQAKLGSIQGVNLPVAVGGAGTETITSNFRQLGRNAGDADFSVRRVAMAASMATNGLLAMGTGGANAFGQIARSGIGMISGLGGSLLSMLGPVLIGTMILSPLIDAVLKFKNRMKKEMEDAWKEIFKTSASAIEKYSQMQNVAVAAAFFGQGERLRGAREKVGETVSGPDLSTRRREAERRADRELAEAEKEVVIGLKAENAARDELQTLERQYAGAAKAGLSQEILKGLYEQLTAAKESERATEAKVNSLMQERNVMRELSGLAKQQAAADERAALQHQQNAEIEARVKQANEIKENQAKAKSLLAQIETSRTVTDTTTGEGIWDKAFKDMGNLTDALDQAKLTELSQELVDLVRELPDRGIFGYAGG